MRSERPGDELPGGGLALDEAWLRVAGQRGTVPLRPLSMTDLLDGAFATIRSRPALMMGTSLAVAALGRLVAALPGLWAAATRSPDEPPPDSGATSAALAWSLEALLLLLLVVLVAVLLTPAVTEAALGRRTAATQWRRHWRARWRRVVALVLVAAASFALGLLPAWTGGVLRAGGADLAGAVLVWVGVIGWVLVWLPLLASRLTPAAAVLLGEDLPARAAVSRAWRLTRGHAWRTLGTSLIAWVSAALAALVMTLPTELVASLIADPEDPQAGFGAVLLADAVSAAGDLAVAAAVLPFLACVIGLIHLDLRMRSEGLAVRLLHDLSRAAAGGRS
ncbi:MAG: hypothetical protein U0Q15_17580 [Kineosporiaceae bacterium]